MTVRILIIDDEHINAKTVALHLSSWGYETAIQDGGLSGINYAINTPDISLILLDLMMPDMYGLDVLDIFKKNPFLRNIPVILQTGIEDEAEINKGLAMGALTCLKKPYSRKDLYKVIGEALQSNMQSNNNFPNGEQSFSSSA